jgi:RimJ/RimL family protein N-acetyltransferase
MAFEPSPFLSGARVVLRALVEADADGPYPHWFNDAEVCRWNSHHVRPYTRELALEYIRGLRNRPDLVLAVTVDGVHVGNVSLQDIDTHNRSADFAIVIGDRSVWGTGVSTEAARLIVGHGFGALNLHRITAGTFAENAAMRALAARLGMVEEGVRRAALFKDGGYHDLVEFGLLVDEWPPAADGR